MAVFVVIDIHFLPPLQPAEVFLRFHGAQPSQHSPREGSEGMEINRENISLQAHTFLSGFERVSFNFCFDLNLLL